MNQYHTFVFILALIAAGCNTTQERRAYQTLATTDELVTLGMETLGAMNRSGELTLEEYNEAKQAYQDYQAAFLLAVDAARFDLETQTRADVLALANRFIALVERLDL